MASNDRTLRDEDGDSSDWIEIINPTAASISLEGWILTDNAAEPLKWRFPTVNLEARGYLLVFASGKNRRDPTLPLHTNFKLDAEGEYLALISPRGEIIGATAPRFPPQRTDTSYGWIDAEVPWLGYCRVATPGAANSNGATGFAPAVRFSRKSGVFSRPFELWLETDSQNAVIRYTLDGKTPDEASAPYGTPLAVTNCIQVRARVYQQDRLPGPFGIEIYLRVGDEVQRFTSDLPVLLVQVPGPDFPLASRGFLASFEPISGITSFSNAPTVASRFAARAGPPLQKPRINLEFWDDFDRERNVEFLGLPAEADWVLYGPNRDDLSLLQNPLMHELGRAAGRYAPRTRFVEVFLNTGSGLIQPTNYYGVYVVTERIRVGRSRLNVGKLKPEHDRLPQVSGAYLLKIDTPDFGENGFRSFPGLRTQRILHVDPKETELTSQQWGSQAKFLDSFFDAFDQALNGPDWLNPGIGYRAYLDAESWIDWHILQAVSGNVDAGRKSTYFYKPRSGPLAFGPLWDFNLAMTSGLPAEEWGSRFLFFGWWDRLLRDPAFWQRWIDRYQEMRREMLSIPSLNARVERLAAEVRLAQSRDQARWNFLPLGQSYQDQVEALKKWLLAKVSWLDRQLVQPPVINPPGGKVLPGFIVAIENQANATTFYTLDGTDPRLPSGESSTGAKRYSGPIRLDANTRLVARSFRRDHVQAPGPPVPSPWSGPVAADFFIFPDSSSMSQLRIDLGRPIRLSYYAVSNFLHEIEFRSDLGPGTWHPLQPKGSEISGNFITVFDEPLGVAKFYRLRMTEIPR